MQRQPRLQLPTAVSVTGILLCKPVPLLVVAGAVGGAGAPRLLFRPLALGGGMCANQLALASAEPRHGMHAHQWNGTVLLAARECHVLVYFPV